MTEIVSFLIGLAGSAFAAIFVTIVARGGRNALTTLFEPIPISHKVAVIGLPGAGKTTLITALFDLIQRGVHVRNVRLHGMNTIKRVNQNVARLNSGEAIGPTKEKDTFVFRFSYKKPSFLLPPRAYDVEIADFPGEYSDRISTDFEAGDKSSDDIELDYTLFNREFFSWIASSREYVFVIDLAAVYSCKNVRSAVADLMARIRTSWQVIEDATSDRGIGSVRHRATHLVFGKTDSLVPIFTAGFSLIQLFDAREEGGEVNKFANVKETLLQRGNSTNLSQQEYLEEEILNRINLENLFVFDDLIQFFRGRARKFNIVYTSMTLRDTKGERIGVRELLEDVLP